METLQRQQAARLALEDRLWPAEKQENFRSLTESGVHQAALVLRHHRRVSSAPDPAGGGSSTGVPAPPLQDGDSRLSKSGTEDKNRSEEGDKLEVTDDEEEEDEDMGLHRFQHRQSGLRGSGLPSQGSTGHYIARVPGSRVQGSVEPVSSESPSHHEWTYEEQFKQVGPAVDPFQEKNPLRSDRITNRNRIGVRKKKTRL